MLELTLHVKPLTINRAWRGRHFSTAAKEEFELRLRYSLPKVAVVGKPFYRVEYDLHLVSFKAMDWDNCIKVLQDCLVARGIISNDSLIVHATVRKYPAKKDRVVVRIEPYNIPVGELEVPGAA
jgi:Holliday junction resolvase RusA-like endonuclease